MAVIYQKDQKKYCNPCKKEVVVKGKTIRSNYWGVFGKCPECKKEIRI